MSVKIFVIFICAAIGTAGGYSVMRAFKRNAAYLENVRAMIGALKRNISYRRDSVASVLGEYAAESPQLKKNIDEYIAYVGEKDGKLTLSRGFLSAQAYKRVCELFSSLGKSDGGTQIGELEMFEKSFDELCSLASEKYTKYGPLAVKLGFLFGLGVGVLFL